MEKNHFNYLGFRFVTKIEPDSKFENKPKQYFRSDRISATVNTTCNIAHELSTRRVKV